MNNRRIIDYLDSFSIVVCPQLNFSEYPDAFIYKEMTNVIFKREAYSHYGLNVKNESHSLTLSDIKEYLSLPGITEQFLEKQFAAENIQAIIYLHEHNVFPARANTLIKEYLEKMDENGETYLHRFMRYLAVNLKSQQQTQEQNNKVMIGEKLALLCQQCGVNLAIKNKEHHTPYDILTSIILTFDHKKYGYKFLNHKKLEIVFYPGKKHELVAIHKQAAKENSKKIFELLIIEALVSQPEKPAVYIEEKLNEFLNNDQVPEEMVVNYFHFFRLTLGISDTSLNLMIDNAKNKEFIRHQQWIGQFANDANNQLMTVNLQGKSIALQSMQLAFAEKNASRKQKGLAFEGFVIDSLEPEKITETDTRTALLNAIRITELNPTTPVVLLFYDGGHAVYSIIERDLDNPKKLEMTFIDSTAKFFWMEGILKVARNICDEKKYAGSIEGYFIAVNFDKTLANTSGCAMFSTTGCFELSMARNYLPPTARTVTEYLLQHPAQEKDFEVYRNTLVDNEESTPREAAKMHLKPEKAKELNVTVGLLPPSLIMSMQSISRIEKRLTDVSEETGDKKFIDQVSSRYRARLFNNKPLTYREKLQTNSVNGVNKRVENMVLKMQQKIKTFITGKSNVDVLNDCEKHSLSGMNVRVKEIEIAHGVYKPRIIKIKP